MPAEPQDVLIRIQSRGGASYSVQAVLADGGVFTGADLTIPDRDLLELDLDANKYGLLLGQALFSPKILQALERAAGEASGNQGPQIRLRLLISPDSDDLHYYAWERIFIPWHGTSIPLSASGSLVFSRFLELERAEEDPLESRPIHITVAVSNPAELPKGMQPIQVDQEVDRIAHVLAGIPDIQVRVHPGRTPLSPELKDSLKKQGIELLEGFTTLPKLVELAGESDVLHILSHGAWNREPGEPLESAKLFLEDEENVYFKALDSDIATRIGALNRKPRIVFLAACDSAKRNPASAARSAIAPPIGLGPKLVAAGIPAVIAMQSELEMETARQLASKFYERVLDHGEVDLALSEARLALYQADIPEWAIPVVFLRIRAGRLFRANPVNAALRDFVTLHQRLPDYEYLPVEAVSLKTAALMADWERASTESVAAGKLWRSLRDFSSRLSDGTQQVLAVIGDSGSGKSTQLKRLASVLAEESLTAGAAMAPGGLRVLPICVDLSLYHDASAVCCTKLEEVVFQSLLRVSPDFTRSNLQAILHHPCSVRLCLLVDGADTLDDDERLDVLTAVSELAAQQPFHCYIVTVDCRYFDPVSWSPTELLVIRQLAPRMVERYLRSDARPAIAVLLEQIVEVNLFDLAAVPWLLLDMRDMSLRGVVLRSRSAILTSVVEQRLSRIGTEKGLRARARRTLSALAWALHSTNREKLPLSEAFQVFRDVRGTRDYNLETLLQELLDNELLVLGQPENVRFAYPALQACCVARYLSELPNPAVEVGRITDTLGRSERMKWWEHALVLYSGMVADPLPFLESLVFGVSLTQGAELFLASRCLIEIAWRMDGPNGPRFAESPFRSMREQVCSALQWRARRINEASWSTRLRAVQSLGRWRRPEAIQFLCDIALQPVATRGKEPAFEYSQIRLAAVRALRRMADREVEIETAGPAVPKLIDAWFHARVYTLEEMLNSAAVGIQGVAAFALGDIRSDEAQLALYKAFVADDMDPATLWAISDAFLEFEPEDVLEQFKDIMELTARTWPSSGSPADAICERLIYLIGEMRSDLPEARAFVETFLNRPAAVALKGRAIIALGKLRVASWRQVWESVAAGDFVKVQVNPAPDCRGALFLRRKAIEALGEIGSLASLIRVRRLQVWDADLDESFFWATERTVTAGAPTGRWDEGEGEKYDGTKRLHAGSF